MSTDSIFFMKYEYSALPEQNQVKLQFFNSNRSNRNLTLQEFFPIIRAHFCVQGTQKPGFPLQVLEIANAISAGFPLQSLAQPSGKQQPEGCGQPAFARPGTQKRTRS
jgi:hypothetical protein